MLDGDRMALLGAASLTRMPNLHSLVLSGGNGATPDHVESSLHMDVDQEGLLQKRYRETMLTSTRRSPWSHHALDSDQGGELLNFDPGSGSAIRSEDRIQAQVAEESVGIGMEDEEDGTTSSEDSEDSADSDSDSDEITDTSSNDELGSAAPAQRDYAAESIRIDEQYIASIFNMLIASRRHIHDIDMVSDLWITTDLDLRSVASRSDVFQTRKVNLAIGTCGRRRMWPSTVWLNNVVPLLSSMQQTLSVLRMSNFEAHGEDEDSNPRLDPILSLKFPQLREIHLEIFVLRSLVSTFPSKAYCTHLNSHGGR
jgi:hypothetical protein